MLKRTMRNIHPGEILREDVLTRTTLSNILNQKSDISPEMCYRIATVFGGTAELWANLQTKFNLAAVADKVKQYKLTPYHYRARTA
jgi:antitoxin HigA-1